MKKPTLGYPSRTDAVLAMRAQNIPTNVIAARCGIDLKTVSALESCAGRRRRPAAAGNRTVLFPQDLLSSLGPHAARRGITPNELARRIVETVIDDGLIDSVLDDTHAIDAECAA